MKLKPNGPVELALARRHSSSVMRRGLLLDVVASAKPDEEEEFPPGVVALARSRRKWMLLLMVTPCMFWYGELGREMSSLGGERGREAAVAALAMASEEERTEGSETKLNCDCIDSVTRL